MAKKEIKSVSWNIAQEPLIMRLRKSNKLSSRKATLMHGKKINIIIKEKLFDMNREYALLPLTDKLIWGKATVTGRELLIRDQEPEIFGSRPDLADLGVSDFDPTGLPAKPDNVVRSYIEGECEQVHNMTTKNGDSYLFDFASQYRQAVEEFKPEDPNAVFMLDFIGNPNYFNIRVLSATKNGLPLDVHSTSLIGEQFTLRWNNWIA
jgi:hypothetical protein